MRCSFLFGMTWHDIPKFHDTPTITCPPLPTQSSVPQGGSIAVLRPRCLCSCGGLPRNDEERRATSLPNQPDGARNRVSLCHWIAAVGEATQGKHFGALPADVETSGGREKSCGKSTCILKDQAGVERTSDNICKTEGCISDSVFVPSSS